MWLWLLRTFLQDEFSWKEIFLPIITTIIKRTEMKKIFVSTLYKKLYCYNQNFQYDNNYNKFNLFITINTKNNYIFDP